MEEKNWMFLSILLNRYHKGDESLLQGFSKDDAENIINQNIDATEASSLLEQPVEKIKHIHYSWFIPHLKNLPKNKLILALSVLPEPHATKLAVMLNETPLPIRRSLTMRTFLLNKLYPTLKLADVLPIDYLPPSKLTAIARFKKFEIFDLIDFLGLYDLAEEIHHIVDKKTLKNIYQCFSPRKHRFLRACLLHKEKLVTQKLQLEHWDGDCKKLKKLLHHRGIVRLGYALSGGHPDLIWHISHILDVGRGNKLARYFHKNEIPSVSKILRSQVLNVIHFFKEKAET